MKSLGSFCQLQLPFTIPRGESPVVIHFALYICEVSVLDGGQNFEDMERKVRSKIRFLFYVLEK